MRFEPFAVDAARTPGWRRLAVFGAIVAVHVLLITSWRIVVAPRPRASVAVMLAPPLSIRFLPAPADTPEPARTAVARTGAATARPRTAEPPTARPPNAPPPNSASTRTSPTVVDEVPSRWPEPTSSPPSAAPSARVDPPPLNLELPLAFRRSASSPERDDRRIDAMASNRPKASAESAMAARFDQRVIEEQLADGVRRIRQGDRCILAHPSRAGGLDPFDRTHSQVAGVEPCPK